MRVIVAGVSDCTDAEAIARELAKIPPGTSVIHGDVPGADARAGADATLLGFRVEPAKNREEFARYKCGAWKGLNERMLASEAVLVLAFHADLARSRGDQALGRTGPGGWNRSACLRGVAIRDCLAVAPASNSGCPNCRLPNP
jgi:hypothetical protein